LQAAAYCWNESIVELLLDDGTNESVTLPTIP
jgi:hypothetical protein